MAGRLRWSIALIVLCALGLSLTGCSAPGSERAAAAAAALREAREEFDLRDQVDGLLAVAARYPGTAAAADAVPTAERALIDGLPNESERVYDDVLPSPNFISESYDLNRLADMVAFLRLVPKTYDAAATRKAAVDLSRTIGEEWVARIREVGKDRVAWARKMRSSGGYSGNYDNFDDKDANAVRFGIDLLEELGSQDDLVSAFKSIVKAIDYGMDATPRSSSTRVRGNTITSTYSLSQVRRCENGGKELVRRAAKIGELL